MTLPSILYLCWVLIFLSAVIVSPKTIHKLQNYSASILTIYTRIGAKGQKNSKWIFQADVSSKKRMNEFYFTTMKPQVDLFSFFFWRKLKTPKRHFEINWPLAAQPSKQKEPGIVVLLISSTHHDYLTRTSSDNPQTPLYYHLIENILYHYFAS